MKKRNMPFVVLIIVSFIVLLIACGRSQAQELTGKQPVMEVEQPKESAPAVEAPQAQSEHVEAEHEVAEPEETEHAAAAHEEAEHEHQATADEHGPAEHIAGHHDVPADAAAVENPVSVTDESIASGEAVYAQNCAVCHGETGEGDGPAAATLEMKPADLHEGHVQELSDGALFWIVSHGRPDTPMPPWDNVLTEEQRWQVVNFLRTFNDAEVMEHEEDVGEHAHADEADAHSHEDGAGEDHHHNDDGHTH